MPSHMPIAGTRRPCRARAPARTIRWHGHRQSGAGSTRLSSGQREIQQLLARDEAILKTLSDAVIVADLSGRILYMNPAGLAMFGLGSLADAQRSHSELRRHLEVLRPDGSPLTDDEYPLIRVLAGQHVAGLELSVRRLNGTAEPGPLRTVSFTGALALDPAGQPLLAVVTVRDVTEHRLADLERAALFAELAAANEALKARAGQLARLSAQVETERERLAAVIENAPIGIMLIDAGTGHTLLANKALAQIWRVDRPIPSHLDGFIDWTGFHEDGRPYNPSEWPIARSMLEREVVPGEEIEIHRVDGTSGTVSVSSSPVLDDQGRVKAAVALAVDVTDRKKAERDLRRARDELQILLDVSSSLVSTLDASRLLQLLISKFREVTGASAVTIFRLVGDELHVLEYEGPMPRAEALAVRLPVQRGFAFRHVLEANEPLYVDDLESESTLAVEWRTTATSEQKQLSAGSRSWLSLPLAVQGRVAGVVRLAHPLPHQFSPETIRLAGGIANQAAIAIENASLHVAAQEAAVWEERERLARELHDSVSQVLFGVDMATYSALMNLDKNLERARERLTLAYNLNKTAQKEMRALIFELRGDTIATNGLVTTLETAVVALGERYNLHLTTELCREPEVHLDVKEAFYRVAVEALNNAGKHTAGGAVTLRLVGTGRDLTLSVTDSGPGFDVNVHYPGHYGLKLMRERATKVGAQFCITSTPDAGTQVSLFYSAPSLS